MTSHPEATPRAACQATTKAGRPCRKVAVEDGYCVFHSGRLDLAELGARGGRARGRKKKEHAGAELASLAHGTLERLMTSGSATAAASAARIALERSPVASEKLIRAAIYAEQQAAMQGELLSARARLERLIEARATVLAEKMYEERKRLDLEAVRQGMSDMSDPPGRRDDTPHPRW